MKKKQPKDESFSRKYALMCQVNQIRNQLGQIVYQLYNENETLRAENELLRNEKSINPKNVYSLCSCAVPS